MAGTGRGHRKRLATPQWSRHRATLSAIKLGLAHIHGDLNEHVCREQSLLTCANIYGICPILRAGGGRAMVWFFNNTFVFTFVFLFHSPPRTRSEYLV